ncbi:tRNA lysidine(34) synthetase TilS [Jatrophihabitans sp. YIM 134969]
MPGPHPAVAATRLAVRRTLADVPGEVVVAVSGGADSLALAAAVAFEAPGRGVVVTVDHGLQPRSAERAAAVVERLRAWPFARCEAVRVHVNAVPGGPGPEAAARDARYDALDASGSPVLLGHTLDDQAETVLLALGRGSGPSALRGMRSGGRRVRPFLGLRRATTRAACAAQDLEPWDDPQNDDPRFRRVRVRHELLPLAEDVLGGGVAEALARTAEQVADDTDLLDALAAQAVSDRVSQLEVLPPALRRRALKLLAERAGAGPLTRVHVNALDRLLTEWHGQGPVDLPGGFGALRVSGRVEVMPTARPDEQAR